jgi:hypothetical protein
MTVLGVDYADGKYALHREQLAVDVAQNFYSVYNIKSIVVLESLLITFLYYIINTDIFPISSSSIKLDKICFFN